MRDGIYRRYNLRVSAFITNNSFEKNMVIVEKGRTVNERAVLVENGVYKGYYYDLNYQITNIDSEKHTHSDAK
jgi:uncharacterized membrane-anchored protein